MPSSVVHVAGAAPKSLSPGKPGDGGLTFEELQGSALFVTPRTNLANAYCEFKSASTPTVSIIARDKVIRARERVAMHQMLPASVPASVVRIAAAAPKYLLESSTSK